MGAAVDKIYEHKDKNIGESGYSHAGKYKIVSEARMKNPSTREWVDCIIYADIFQSDVYAREKQDFFDKFKELEEFSINPLQSQVGGSHYKDLKIQPVEYIHANGFDFLTGNIIKYASRHKNKNGAEDVKKIIHYAELILKLEYGKH